MTPISRRDARRKGLKRYYTGNPCHQGHHAERYISTKVCVECQRLSNAGALVQRAAKRCLPRIVTTDYSHLTEGQVEAWYANMRALRPNVARYKHRPLDELNILWQPPMRFPALA